MRGLTLRLDANQAWSCEQLAAFGAAVERVVGDGCGLAHRALEYCEEPLCAAELSQLPALHASHALRYALDESLIDVSGRSVTRIIHSRDRAIHSSARLERRGTHGRSEWVPCPGSPQLADVLPPTCCRLARAAGPCRLPDRLRARCPAAASLAPTTTLPPRTPQLEPEPLARLVADPGCAALILKPTLLGVERCAHLALLAAQHGKACVFTSAFESGVAHAHVTLLAAVFGGASVAHGLSTYERLAADLTEPAFASSVHADVVDVGGAQALLDQAASRYGQRSRAARL